MRLYVLTILVLFMLMFPLCVKAQITLLEADGPGDTYELINRVFAPNGGDAVESPDCAHPEFGRHIRESWDDFLKKHVFEFHIHVTPDNDRCIRFDRQRLEIKTFEPSPDHMKVVLGETVEYKWKFRIPVGFSVSPSFTHLHQIKPVGGDESTPTFALTARSSTGAPTRRMELSYYPTTAAGLRRLATVNLALFEGQWVEVTQRFRAAVTGGSYFIEIVNLATGAVIMSHRNDNISTFRPDNRFHRPKWGIYRSLVNAQDLRDEVVLFADFSIQELVTTDMQLVRVVQSGFELMPNPAKSTVVLKFIAENTGSKDVLVTSLCGKIMFKQSFLFNQGVNNITLNLGHLDAGTYIVSLGYEMPGKSLILTH